MQTVTDIIAIPLGYAMNFCYKLLGDYGLAIILFTFLTKIILLPLSVWIQKNSIKMVQIQPQVNRIKAKFFGSPDTIAEEESKLYKREKYHPLASLIPLAVQLILLMGVVAVIYHPLDYIFHMDKDFIASLTELTAHANTESSAAELSAIEAIKSGNMNFDFAPLVAKYPNIDVMGYIDSIRSFDLQFLGFNLSWNPSEVLGISVLVPIVAGLSSLLLSAAQNASNVLQAEQGKVSKYGMLALSVGLSLYLGFFVPAGIALYWIASNLLAIVQLYALNAVIPPKKYVDYAELEASRKELAALENLGDGKKVFKKDPNSKREKADYKRFFSIANKHVVFYSERSGFYKYYKEIIEGLLKKTNLSIHYVTNDPDDKIFEKAEDEPRIKPYYISVKKLIPLMMKMDADIVIMTTPELDNGYIKRSYMRKDVEYIYVPHDSASMNMGFKEHALDNFDTVFCVGPHISREIRASEKHYGTKEKRLVEFGYPFIDGLIDSCSNMKKENNGGRKQILIGPSWQEDNLLDSCIDELIEQLYSDEYRIVVRPHPEYMKRYKPRMDALVEKYKDKIGDGLVFELDFSSNSSTYTSDLLITDWSGLSFEFCFATLKPALFINTKMKMENPHYADIGVEPQEIGLRNKIGIALDKNQLDKTAETVKMLLDGDRYHNAIKEIRNGYYYALGSYGAAGIKYIVDDLVEISKNRK